MSWLLIIYVNTSYLALKFTATEAVEKSVTNNNPSQGYNFNLTEQLNRNQLLFYFHIVFDLVDNKVDRYTEAVSHQQQSFSRLQQSHKTTTNSYFTLVLSLAQDIQSLNLIH